jgi:succinate dehydrogenase/fumarate reductase flavoprotein subunit
MRLGAVFRKGYQWPFDVRKLDGSSRIDLLVFQETVLRGRRVFLDFSMNPGGGLLDFARLDAEAAGYLNRTGAVQDTPIERLKHLNQPAVDFYATQGVNLAADWLEIRLCAQHHNGGLAADSHWQSNLRGLYPVGEVNGSHGIYRPGGSALNSGQVGALRASEAILADRRQPPAVLSLAGIEQVAARINWLEERLDCGRSAQSSRHSWSHPALSERWLRAVKRMSQVGGPFRPIDRLDQAIAETGQDAVELEESITIRDPSALGFLARYRELLSTQRLYLAAMRDYAVKGGGSRGSAVYLESSGQVPAPGLPPFFKCRPAEPDWSDRIQEVLLVDGRIQFHWRPVVPLPHPDEAFETVWRIDRQAWHNRR